MSDDIGIGLDSIIKDARERMKGCHSLGIPAIQVSYKDRVEFVGLSAINDHLTVPMQATLLFQLGRETGVKHQGEPVELLLCVVEAWKSRKATRVMNPKADADRQEYLVVEAFKPQENVSLYYEMRIMRSRKGRGVMIAPPGEPQHKHSLLLQSWHRGYLSWSLSDEQLARLMEQLLRCSL